MIGVAKLLEAMQEMLPVVEANVEARIHALLEIRLAGGGKGEEKKSREGEELHGMKIGAG
jgi:hypothetical protein